MVFRDLDKQALKQNAYTVLSKITLLNDNSVFTEDDFIVDWTYEDYRYVPDVGFVGQFVERILDGNLQNIPENKIFENQEINLQIGIVNALDNMTTWYDYGNFLITKVEKTDTTGRYKFESADYTKKFNKEYVDTINYPCLALDLANNICNQANVELESNGNMYYYIVDENGLAAGNYKFNINNLYYNFTLASALTKNDVLYFIAYSNRLILKKVTYNEGTGYNVTRELITYTTSSTAGSNTLLEMRSTNYVNFTNNDFVIENNQYEENNTLRKVMQDIGKLAYSWVRVGEDNKIHIDFEQSEITDNYDRLSTDEYYVSKKSDLPFGPVNKVLLGMSNIEGENLYRTSSSYTEETECAIEIWDNNLTYTEDLRAIALLGCDRLFGIEYMPLEIETIGHPWLNGNEKIELNNVDGEQLETYPFNRKITYAGYIKGVIGAEASTSQNSEYEYEGELINQVNKTSITVDKHNQTITSLVSDVSDAKSSISTLEQTTDSIGATVDYLNNEYETNVVVRKSVEGNPIEVEDAGPYALESFRIYGNAVQEITGEEAGTTIEVNGSATLTDVDTNKESRVTKLLGQTSQFTTTGKNKIFWQSGATQLNNLVVTENADKSINITGTPNNSWSNITPNTNYTLPAGTYTFSINKTLDIRIGVALYNTNDDTVYGRIYPGNKSVTLTTPSSTAKFRIFLEGLSTTTNYSIQNLQIQLEVGSTATSYEPYTGGTASPNPSYPQDIHVVSGDNYIDIWGKNFWGNLDSNVSRTHNGIDFVNNADGTISASGTATNGAFSLQASVARDRNHIITLQPGTYTLSGGISSNKYVQLMNSAGTEIAYDYGGGKTFTISVETQGYIRVYINNGIVANDTFYPMIEKGSTATTYEPYIGNSYPIYLGVENLFTYDSVTLQYTSITPCKVGDKFSLSFKGSATSSQRVFLRTYDGNNAPTSTMVDNVITYVNTTPTDYTATITSTTNGYLYLVTSVAPTDFVLENIKITKGDHVQYISNNPIELCKIGTYQDYIYKENGTWYLHKEIGKVVLKGDNSESWSIFNTGATNWWYQVSNIITANNTESVRSQNKCNRYVYAVVGTSTTNQGIWYGDTYIRIRYGTEDTINNYKTWLSTHNVIAYYVLSTPTTTEITNALLLSQLNDLESE